LADNDVQNAIWELLSPNSTLLRASQLGSASGATTNRVYQAWPRQQPRVDSIGSCAGYVTMWSVNEVEPHFGREEEYQQVSIFSRDLNRNLRVKATIDGLLHRKTLTMDANWCIACKRTGSQNINEAENSLWHTAVTYRVKRIAK
jgi:hypothetical protein